MKKRKPLTDEQGEVRELLLDDIKQFRPMSEAVSVELAAKLGLENRAASPSRKERVSIRLSRDVLDRFRGFGKEWESRMDAALREWLKGHPQP